MARTVSNERARELAQLALALGVARARVEPWGAVQRAHDGHLYVEAQVELKVCETCGWADGACECATGLVA